MINSRKLPFEGENVLSISLLKDIYNLNESNFIELTENILLRKGTESDLNFLRNHIGLFHDNSNNEWINYFENEIIPNKHYYNGKTKKLSEKDFRYAILQSNKFIGFEEEVALKISDLDISILIQKGITLDEGGNVNDNSEIAYIKDYLNSHNQLIDYKYKLGLYGSKKYLRKSPNIEHLRDFNETLKNIEIISNNKLEYLNIYKALQDFMDIDKISNESTFKLIGYFSIIESLITHNPKLDYGKSISKQLSNKIELLNNNFFEDFNFRDYFKGSNSNTLDTIIYKLYNYRSDIAHGNIPKFEKELVIIQNNINNVIPFMEKLLRMILKLSVSKPNLINDLKKC